MLPLYAITISLFIGVWLYTEVVLDSSDEEMRRLIGLYGDWPIPVSEYKRVYSFIFGTSFLEVNRWLIHPLHIDAEYWGNIAL